MFHQGIEQFLCQCRARAKDRNTKTSTLGWKQVEMALGRDGWISGPINLLQVVLGVPQRGAYGLRTTGGRPQQDHQSSGSW